MPDSIEVEMLVESYTTSADMNMCFDSFLIALTESGCCYLQLEATFLFKTFLVCSIDHWLKYKKSIKTCGNESRRVSMMDFVMIVDTRRNKDKGYLGSIFIVVLEQHFETDLSTTGCRSRSRVPRDFVFGNASSLSSPHKRIVTALSRLLCL